ncbi:hypothetical protein PRBEI_2001824700 [Prionailurus iriomotensis]
MCLSGSCRDITTNLLMVSNGELSARRQIKECGPKPQAIWSPGS